MVRSSPFSGHLGPHPDCGTRLPNIRMISAVAVLGARTERAPVLFLHMLLGAQLQQPVILWSAAGAVQLQQQLQKPAALLTCSYRCLQCSPGPSNHPPATLESGEYHPV